jgi:outer membrane lipoprotein carrier protein
MGRVKVGVIVGYQIILLIRAGAKALALPLLVFVCSGVSTVDATESGVEQLRGFLSATRSAQGQFTQQVFRASGGRALESTGGEFAFMRPGRFRWEVRKPFEQLIVSDGERLWFHDKDLNQVTVRRLEGALGGTPAAILFGGAGIEDDFVLRDLGERDGLQWVEAIARQSDSQGLDRVLFGLRNRLPEAMEVRDALGRTTVFGFSRIERNPVLDAASFRFAPPAGAELIEQR